MKFFSSFSLLVVVLLSACGTFEVSIEQPLPTATPAAITSNQPQDMDRSTIGDIQEGSLFVGDESSGWSKMIIVSGDMNWIAIIDNGQMIVLVHQPESQTALAVVDGNDKTPQDFMYPEGFQQTVDMNSNTAVAGISWIQWPPDPHLHQQSLKTHPEEVVAVQQLDDMPTLLVTKAASVLFLNKSNRLPVLIDFSDSPNTSPAVND